MSLSFEARIQGATLALTLPAEDGDAVHAALELARHEPLCAALESWLGEPLDPYPAPPSSQALHGAVSEQGVRLGLPWALLERASQAPALALAWDELVFDVELAGYDAAPMPDDATGGALLLPPAFTPPWRVTLRSRSHGLSLAADWPGPGEALKPAGRPRKSEAPAAAWRVQLDEAWRATPPALLGWQPASPRQLGAAAQLVGPRGPRCGGRIVPALWGSALVIDA